VKCRPPSSALIFPSDLQRRILAVTRARIQAGVVTQRRLAVLTHCSQPQISNVLLGRRRPAPEMLDALVSSLGISPAELYGPEIAGWAKITE
jgi:transcriptional regulator with XRE-family HTH domain